MVDFTVAIPTYNGEDRLSALLDRLRSQVNVSSFQWEVLVVDNNSTDNTASVVRQFQQNWPLDAPLRYCFAAEQGAAFARQRAVEVARGTWIGFLDDDNLPASNWVEQAYQFGQAHPEVGAFGSQIHGQFESQPPSHIKSKVAPFLALIERGSKPHRYEPRHKILPAGAGVVVRRQAWLDSVPARLFLNNKGKDSGLASEDLEVFLHIQRAGWEIWYNPDMVVYHHIPDSRLEKEYLVLLFRCIGLSRFYIRMLGMKSWQRPLMLPAYVANDIRKLAIHLIKHRRAENLDVLTACEREHLITSLVSPLFLLKKACADVGQRLHDRAYLPRRQECLQSITEAFEQDRFCLYHQSVIALQDREQGKAFEVLLRIRQEEGKTAQSPLAFLDTAERYNLMRTIDRWVIRKFFETQGQQYELLSKTDQTDYQSLYSINLSGSSVNDPRLIDLIDAQFRRYTIPKHLICFEITEKVAIANIEAVYRLAHQMRELGCRLALDDVGHRRSALGQLKQLPLDYLKINGSFVKRILNSPAHLKITAAINQAAHEMGVSTVAKYVETNEILEKIRALGIDYAQGHGIDRPQPFFLQKLPPVSNVPELTPLSIP